MEKHRDNSSHGEGDEYTVTIMAKAKKIRLSEGKNRANDLVAELRKQYPNELRDFKFDHTTNAVLNGQVVEMNDKGEIEGNPVLSVGSTLSLMPRIDGGN